MNDMERKYKSALVALMLGRFGLRGAGAFYSAIAIKLPGRCSPEVETFATNGKEIIYNPEFINTLPEREIVGVIAHEIMHVALLHHCRKGNRDHQRWNLACDLAINSIIIESGLSLPSCAVIAGVGKFAKMAPGKMAEQYYNELDDSQSGDKPDDQPGNGPGDKPDDQKSGGPGDKPSDQSGDQPSDKPGDQPGSGAGSDQSGDKPGSGAGSGGPKPAKKQGGNGGFGEVLEAPSPKEAEAEARALVAMASEMCRGNMPGGVRNAIDSVRPSVDWRKILQDLLTRKVRQDYVYTRPSRRASAGVILPILGGKACPKVAVLIDTSGSINHKTVSEFVAEIKSFRDNAKSDVVLIMHHVHAYSITEISPEDEFVLPPVLTGGTSHVDPIHKALVAEAEIIVALTDCHSVYPDDPNVDVIWVRYDQGCSPGEPPAYGSLVDIVGE